MQGRWAFLFALRAALLSELLVISGGAHLRTGEQFFAYDYSQHGKDWAAGACASRSRQSPIDLPAAAPLKGTFLYKYNPITSPFELINNGHTYAIDLMGLGVGGITHNNAFYNLMNINIHSLSEHAWAGVQQPLELHLVHKRFDTADLLVVAIGVESPKITAAALAAARAQGAKAAFLELNTSQPLGYQEPLASDPSFNPALQAFLKTAPPAVNTKVMVPADPVRSFDFNRFLEGAKFYEYHGSLTAPPCAEIATWLVRKDTIKASDKQVLYLHDAVYKTTADFGNYRSLMPLNGRVVNMLQGIIEDLPPPQAPVASMAGSPQASDREFRAMKWAMDAMTIAKSSTDYVKDLDNRLRKAAEAHANALAIREEPLKVKGQVGGGLAAPGEVGSLNSPLQMQATARQMARSLADAAREQIEDAMTTITRRSKEVAMESARQAAGIVGSGEGSSMAMAMAVPTRAPPPAAIPAAMNTPIPQQVR